MALKKLGGNYWSADRPAQPANGGEVRTGYAPAQAIGPAPGVGVEILFYYP